MAFRLFIMHATRHQSQVGKVKTLFDKRNRLCCSQVRFQSLLGGAHETTGEVAQQNDPEAVITEFESQTSLHVNPAAISEYVKALLKLDRLDQSQFLLNTFQKGLGMNEEEVQPIVDVESNTTFKDYVKGASHPKQELKEIVEYLRDPEVRSSQKGYLLAGPIGISKIMLAHAIAREAGVPLFSCNGHDFETDLADGARRMRNLFAAAKKQSRSIIFIDEIDKIHTKMIFNQLIVELDGLKQGIIVIAATRVRDSLYKALLKRGRFDRRADFLKPDECAKIR